MCFVFSDVQVCPIPCDELMGHSFCINPSELPRGTCVASFLGLKSLQKFPSKVRFLKPEGSSNRRHFLIMCEVISNAVTASAYVCMEGGACDRD